MPRRPGRRHRTTTRSAEAPRPTKAVHPGLRLLEPVLQGELDGLCGVWSIINAIRLVAAPQVVLSRQQTRTLFAAAASFLDENDALVQAVTRTVKKELWPRLARHLVEHGTSVAGVPLILEQPLARQHKARRAALAAIELMILEAEVPVVRVTGELSHYTVICGYSPASLRLFDSYELHHLRKSACAVKPATGARHRLHVETMLVFSLSR